MARLRATTRAFRFRSLVGQVWTIDDLERAGQLIARRVIERTQGGVDEDRRRFTPYTPAYAKRKGCAPSDVDLTLSGDMLGNFGVLWTGRNRVRVGFSSDAMRQRAGYNEARGRRFLGVPESWIREVRNQLRRVARL